ncbi:MAG: cobalamin B12-binding domain-containing protein [Anaerolineales bacterium]|nr:cobalamin B12-binding domain-containing protein [Anaerolineales bacterium]
MLLLSLLLRYRGWDVVYLGANVPLSQLESTLEAVKPELVILSAQRLQTAATLAQTAELLHKRRVNSAYGGSIFNLTPGLRQRVYSHFLGESIEDAVTAIGQIMTFKPSVSHIEPVSDVYEQASLNYRVKRNLIELDTMQMLESKKSYFEFLDKTNSRLARDILAALQLGDMNFINPEMKLSQKLISNYGISQNWQTSYFDAYFRAVEKNLNEVGTPIIEWLDRVRSDLQLAQA